LRKGRKELNSRSRYISYWNTH